MLSSALRASRRLGLVTALALLAVGVSKAEAQQGAVTGQVIEASNQQPITGAQVSLEGTQLGTLTGEDGNYRITGVPAGEYTVQVQAIGYSQGSRTVTVQAGQSATADFELSISAIQLEEVAVNVVTGLAQQRRSMGTNTGVISAEQVNTGPVNSFEDLLQGRSAGVNLESTTGTTGAGQRLRIRGSGSLSLSNSPLIYIDGTRVRGSSDGLQSGITGGQDISLLSSLNPQNIESVEVLKGPAATAEYGSAASNGVILITTKAGGGAAGTQWHTYAEFGSLHDVTDYPANVLAFENQTGVSDPPYFITYNDGGLTPDGTSENVTPGLVPCTNFNAAAGLCTQDLVYRHNSLKDPRTSPFERGTRRNLGFNVSSATGGGTSFFVSGGWETEQNVLPNNELEKWNGLANVNFQPRNDLSISIRTQYINQSLDLPNNDNSLFSPLINGMLAAPAYMPGDGGAVFTSEPFRGRQASWAHYGFFFTPDELSNVTSTTRSDRFILGTDGRYQPLEWLSFRYNLGADLNFRDDGIVFQEGMGNIGGGFSLGFRDRSTGRQNTFTANVSSQAVFDLTDDIRSTTVVGGAYDQEDQQFTTCSGAGLISDIPSCSGTTQLFSVSESFFKIRSMAGFISEDIAISDRLFLSASVRADDNSAFGGNIGTEFYPSGSVSWVASDEPFFPDSDVLSSLRLRGAFGYSGNRPGFRDARSLYSPVTVTSGGSNLKAVTVSSTGNPDLNPERVREVEGGFDAGFFEDRVNLQLTYYDRRSRDALIARDLPPSFGLTGSVFENLGEIKNSGFEVSLNGTAVRAQDATVSFNAAFTTNDNEIIELGEGIEPITFGQQAHKEGFSAGAFHQPKIEWEDPDDDGLLALGDVSTTTDSAVFIDESTPTWTLSFGTGIDLFGFLQLDGQAEARGGHSQMNGTESFRCQRGFTSNIRPTACRAVGNPDASLEEQATFIGAFNYGTEVGYIEDATFLKIREVSASIMPPTSLVQAAPWTEGMRLSVSGRNVATFTGYSGIDPELNWTGAGAGFEQEEFNTQPPPMVLSVRVDYRF